MVLADLNWLNVPEPDLYERGADRMYLEFPRLYTRDVSIQQFEAQTKSTQITTCPMTNDQVGAQIKSCKLHASESPHFLKQRLIHRASAFVARASHCLRDTNMAWTSSLASRAVSPTQKSIKLVYCTVQTWNSQAHGTSKQSKSPKSKNRFRWLMQQISSNAFLCPKSAIPIRSLSQPMQQYNALMHYSYIISSNDNSNFANVGQC